jgi:glycosyltransferase involved in cell wall biosynthesis
LGDKVVIIHSYITHYRKPFFDKLKSELNKKGIEIQLIYGEPSNITSTKNDAVELSWGIKINNKYFKFLRKEFLWQPCIGRLKDADLIIITQASSILLNYILMFKQLMGIQRVAYWGHGINFNVYQANIIGESIKRYFSRKAHWWFAYTELSAKKVEEFGFPRNKISIVQNTINTEQLLDDKKNISSDHLYKRKSELGIVGKNTCIFIGSIYSDKRIEFLIDAVRLVKKQIIDFELLIIGSGPDESIAKDAAKNHNWIYYLGPKLNNDRIPYFLMSRLVLIPGSVGLVVIDSFVFEIPLVTTNYPNHGPEIQYLINGVNGIMVDDYNDIGKYARTIIKLLNDDNKIEILKIGCRESASKYTMKEMSNRFIEGIECALNS